MQSYLYKDLYILEDTHFWHIGKREVAMMFIKRVLSRAFPHKKPSKGEPFCGGPPARATRWNILDIGCGTGKNLEMLNQFGNVQGIDISMEAIKYCHKRKLYNVKIGQAEKTGFNKNSFDLITMFDVLEHTDERNSLNEVKRILKRGGYLLLTVPVYQWLWSKWDEVLEHRKRYKRDEMEKMLDKYGFKIIKSSHLFFYLLIPVIITRFIKRLINKKSYESDFSINNNLINTIGLILNKIEQILIRFTSLPFGTSIIVLATKY